MSGRSIAVQSQQGRSAAFRRGRTPFWLALGFLLCIGVFSFTAPGFVGTDAADQYRQALSGSYAHWHPPLLAAFWRQLIPILPGQLPMALLSLLALWGAATAVLVLLVRSAYGAVLAGLVLAFPPVFVAFLLVSKEALAFGAVLAGIALLGRAVGEVGRRALAWEGAALLFFCLGAVLRFELAPVVGLLAGVHFAFRSVLPSRAALLGAAELVRRGAVALGLAAIFAIAAKLTEGWISFGLLKARPGWPETTLMLHNLAALSVATGENLVPASRFPEGYDFARLTALFHPAMGDFMFWPPDGGPRLRITYDTAEEFAELRGAWLSALAQHPLAFVKHRLTFGAHLLGLHPWPWPAVPPLEPMLSWHTAVVCRDFGLPATAAGFGCTPAVTWPLRAMLRVSADLERLHLVRGYVALLLVWSCGGALLWRLRGNRRAGWVVCLLAGAATAHVLVLVIAAPSVQLRYFGLVWTAAAILLLALVHLLVMDATTRLRRHLAAR